MSLLLSCESLAKAYGTRTLFSGISLGLFDNERTGLIGPNGAGKSTFMRIVAGLEVPDAGEIVTRRQLHLAYVAQDDRFAPDLTVEDVLTQAIEGEHIPDRERAASLSTMLGRMGFADRYQPVSSLSGGWRKRLAIARALITRPELLLLDEPTNHLDLEGIEWLEDMLSDAPFACIVITHDRYFLENVTNRVIELNRAYPEGFFSVNGPYSQFLEKREELLEAQVSQQASLAGKVRREVEWLKRGAKARTTKAKGRIEEAQSMMADLAALKARNAAGQTISVDFSATDRKTRKLLAFKGVEKSLGGQTLFKGVDCVLSPGTKLGLLGPNGSGKTTLLRLMTGDLQPDRGEIQRADGLRIVLFDQHRQQLDLRQTLRQALSPKSDLVVYRDTPIHVSGWARRFLFRTEQLDMAVGELSGGEQARILIAQLMLRPADVLILDEPTNDLDIPSLDVLEESLEDFPGALVMVTHDRYMLDRMCTDLLGLDGLGGWGMYADLSQWERARDAAIAAKSQAEQAAREQARKAAASSSNKPAKSTKRLTWNEQKELETIESRILEAEADVEARHKEMEDPALLADRTRLDACCARMHESQELVQKLYHRWQELEEKRA